MSSAPYVLLALAVFLHPAVFQADDLSPGYWEQTPLPQTGLATFYSPGMMEYVEGYRRERNQLPECPECVGTVALLRAGDIGRKVWLQPPGGERVGPFLVIDCAHPEDIPPLLEHNWAVDVSYDVGQLWGMDQPLDGVTVLADPADEGAPPAPLSRPTPFYVRPDQVVVTRPTPSTGGVTPPVPPMPGRPTPWPTRQPEPLPGVPTLEAPMATPAPAGPPLPTPLTPIVTTPTPRVRATAMPPATQSPVSTPVPQPSWPAPEAGEVSVGRPGSGLLQANAPLPAPTRILQSSPSPTVRAVMTPLVTSAPILSAPAMTPTPVPSQNDSPLLRLWRALLSLIGR